MAQSWLVTRGSEEEKKKAVEGIWTKNFGQEKFPVFDVLPIEGDPIKISQIREASGFLNVKPVAASAKVLMIKGAERMTLAAANAFLKTLEEPPGQSLIFLLTDKPDELPETILSRCQIIRLATTKMVGFSKEEEELARQLAKGNVGERLAILGKARGGRGEFLLFIKKQISLWRQLLLSHVGEEEKKVVWFRQGVGVWLAAEKMVEANVNLKLVEGWVALFLPGKRSREK